MADMSAERWRPVRSGAYEVSDRGQVRRVLPAQGSRPGKVLRASSDNRGKGYPRVALREGGRYVHVRVHRLVTEAFIGPCPDGHEVNHRDGNPRNNDALNLEYVTHAGNQQHASASGLLPRGEAHRGSKLSADDVIRMRLLHGSGSSLSALSTVFGVCKQTVHDIVTRKKWRHVV